MVVHMRDHLADTVLDPLFLSDVSDGAPANNADVEVSLFPPNTSLPKTKACNT